MSNVDLSDRVVAVTGASSGIGVATALACAAAGAAVAMAAPAAELAGHNRPEVNEVLVRPSGQVG